MIGICQNIIKQTTASSFSPITKSARISQKVQMVKAEEGSPKSSSLLYRYINPLCKRAFFTAFTVLWYRISSAAIKP